MRTIATIIKKEFARFFKDYRLLITAILLPGVVIYLTYTVMGSIIDAATAESDDPATVYVVNMPADEQLAKDMKAVFTLVTDDVPAAAEAKGDVAEGKAQLYVVFPQNIDGQLHAEKQEISVYYDSTASRSATAYSVMCSFLSDYQSRISNVSVNGSIKENYDLADSEDFSKNILAMIIPMILLMMLFSGCMAVAPESIAGEKERGTMATLLVTPVKRSHIAIGKIVALSCIALLSGLSSTLGLILSLPRLANGMEGVSLSMFGFGEYMAMLGIVLSSVLILVSAIAIISAFAKTVKEASGLVVPVMLVVLLCGVASMFAQSINSIGIFFIPVFNSACAISAVILGTVSAGALAATICTNVAFTVLLAFVLTKMFSSEKIMFKR